MIYYTKANQAIFTAKDEAGEEFCYIWLKVFNNKIQREISYRVDFDLCDRELVANHNWYIHDWAYVMAVIRPGNGVIQTIYMHREIMKDELTEELKHVDHIDHVKNNNRRQNLRVVDIKANNNNMPQRALYGRDFIQVIHPGRYEAYIPTDDGSELIGVYETRIEAIESQKYKKSRKNNQHYPHLLSSF